MKLPSMTFRRRAAVFPPFIVIDKFNKIKMAELDWRPLILLQAIGRGSINIGILAPSEIRACSTR